MRQIKPSVMRNSVTLRIDSNFLHRATSSFASLSSPEPPIQNECESGLLIITSCIGPVQG